MKRTVEPTEEQLKDLKRLARALGYTKEVAALKARLKAFRDDNADALSGDGVEIDGLNVRVKRTLELIVEAA